MKNNKRFFSKTMTAIAVFESLFLICDFANAATRATSRSVPTTRKNVSTVATTTTQLTAEQETTTTEPVVEQIANESAEVVETPLILQNKSNQFAAIVSEVMENAGPDNSFAELIRQQREALAASEASYLTTSSQNKALSSNSHSCDVELRKCMSSVCGNDFTKCATDGDTIFGDKLNKCKRDTKCSAQEFSQFAKEIKADRDTNVQLAGYNAVLDCGNNYNACIMNECGTTYNKCLGKSGENSAIQKCATIARECAESDSGLSARFGTAIGKLRENAESDIKKDESRLYALRDSMEKQCKSLGATFDSRTFDCVYTVEFFAGENQSVPLASRKAYAGDSFVCNQEWFGINTTTARENAYRETASQTAASSAMLGSGVGMAAGALSSGAVNRAIETTKAKNELKKAEKELKNAEKEQQKNEQENKDKNDQSGSGLGAIIKDKITGVIGNAKKKVNEIGTDTPKDQNQENEAPTLTQEQQDALAIVGASLKNGKNPTQAVQQMQIDNAIKKAETTTALTSIPATVSALSSDGQPVVNTKNETSSSTSEQQPATKKEVKPRTDSTNTNNDKATAKAQKKTEKEQEKQLKAAEKELQKTAKGAARKDRQETRDANRQAREEARTRKKEAKNNAPKPENNNTNTNSNTTTGNNNTAPAAKPSEPATPSTTTATNAVTAAATTATVATTPTPQAKPETTTEESAGEEVWFDGTVISPLTETQTHNSTPPQTNNNHSETNVISSIAAITNVNNIDLAKDGIVYRAKNIDNSCSHAERVREYNGYEINASTVQCNNMSLGQWDVLFNYGKITGLAKCSNQEATGATYAGRAWNGKSYYTQYYKAGTPGNTSGKYCYCSATHPGGQNWIYQPIENSYSEQNCKNRCATMCAVHFQDGEALRKAIFGKQ